jgi:hypothetical protein
MFWPTEHIIRLIQAAALAIASYDLIGAARLALLASELRAGWRL